MIPDHLIDKAARALIRGRGRDPEETVNLPELTGALHDAAVILEAVAADIWDEGYEASTSDGEYDPWSAVAEYAAYGHVTDEPTPNPYRASETA